MYSHPAKLSKEEMRHRVSACRTCLKATNCSAVFEAPRFGLGNRDNPQLMIVGQNPPRDPDRCLHGAWMLHYLDEPTRAKRGPHELLVAELLVKLGLGTGDVYGTQAVKCPTPANSIPGYGNMMNCLHHLDTEIRDVNPKVILSFGDLTHRAVMEAMGYFFTTACYQTWYVEPIGACIESTVKSVNNIINAPHPSKVGRFINKDSWFSSILEAYAATKDKPRGLTQSEVVYNNTHGDRGQYGFGMKPTSRTNAK